MYGKIRTMKWDRSIDEGDKKPRVLLSLRERGHCLPAIIDVARKWGWNLVDLRPTKDVIPSAFVPKGALISCLPDSALALQLRRTKCPAVRIGMYPHPEDELLPAILMDQRAKGKLAAEHFVERGFTHVAYLGNSPWALPPTIYESLKEHAEKLGATCHLHQVNVAKLSKHQDTSERYMKWSQETAKWLKTLPKPVALLCYSDDMATRVCSICENTGLNIPGEVALLGIGNTVSCSLSPVTLSSIDDDADERGRRAAHLLKQLMQGKPAPTAPIMIPPKGVVSRQSTKQT